MRYIHEAKFRFIGGTIFGLMPTIKIWFSLYLCAPKTSSMWGSAKANGRRRLVSSQLSNKCIPVYLFLVHSAPIKDFTTLERCKL